MKSWKYVPAGAPKTINIKVANPSEGFDYVDKEATAKQVEAGFTGTRVLINSDHGTIGIDIWGNNIDQIDQILDTLSAGGEVAMTRKTQHRIDEETELVDNTDGIPNKFYDWSLPRVGKEASVVKAKLESLRK